MFVQISNNRNLFNDVFSDAGDIGEEEEGKDSGCGAEVGSCAAAANKFVSRDFVERGKRVVR